MEDKDDIEHSMKKQRLLKAHEMERSALSLALLT